MRNRQFAVMFFIFIAAITGAVLVAKRVTGLPVLIILSLALLFAFVIGLAIAFTVPQFAEHKSLRNACVILFAPLPVLALVGFLLASGRFWLALLAFIVAFAMKFWAIKTSRIRLKRIEEEKIG